MKKRNRMPIIGISVMMLMIASLMGGSDALANITAGEQTYSSCDTDRNIFIDTQPMMSPT